MPALLALLIPSLVPMFTDTVRGIVNKFTGNAGAQPSNVAEAVQLMEAETKRAQALAALDKPEPNISPWVANLRASCRYIIAIIVVVNAVAILYVPGTNQAFADLSMNLAGSVWSFLFGERMYIGIKSGAKK
jgi:hypothetical protein